MWCIGKEIFSYSGNTAVPYAKEAYYVPENGHTLLEYEYRNNNGYQNSLPAQIFHGT